MEWQAEAIVLSATKLGEADAVLDVMTREQGRYRGFVKGGLSRRNKANLQVGNRLFVSWRSRIETNLGRFTVELNHSPLGQMIGDGARLSALSTVASIISSTMTERESHEGVYISLQAIINLLENQETSLTDWAAAFSRLEMGILQELGYGLDLSECAATGSKENLVYVSPKSARAVSESAGFPYKEKLLSLPQYLLPDFSGEMKLQDVIQGMQLTGYFLDRNIWNVRAGGQPAARDRFMSTLMKQK